MITDILGGIAGGLMSIGSLLILGYGFYRDDARKSLRPAYTLAIVNVLAIAGLITTCIVIAG